jgi:uncharacterized protein YdeI (YjbR/CyaY-like superfamily)
MKSKSNPSVDFFFQNAKQWQAEFIALRAIALDCGLTEVLKWGTPCYTLDSRNIVLMHGFKDYCALLFFKGALLKDPGSILVQQSANVQATRQIRFTSVGQIKKLKAALKAYIRQAMEVEKAGLKVTFKKSSEFAMAEEFQHSLDKSAALKKAFHALTPGRQRAYLLYFSQPKQSQTRKARVEKCKPHILQGKGLND